MSKLIEFLKKEKILHLATIDYQNTPHIVPVWYLYSTRKIYVGTNTRTQKAKNIKVHKKVSFCVDVGVIAPNIFGVMGKGTAKLLKEKSTVNKIAKKILLRYFKSLENKSAKELLEDTDCIIEILPTEFSNWKY
ncbi:MAG: pyridoxamine 5'-phosphate oxidase family protein [Candidatus Nitrosopelagicus sp.]|nr:pyridoxamine 5'-phosphate oxidase family protein [Candidatus Nitrosopelagicus sp.]